MLISLNWLKDYIDLDVGVDELCEKMTMLGLEIEAVNRPSSEFQGIKVGAILSIEPHPDADKLVVCKTDVGEETPLQIVCGAKNMKPGDLVATATVGGSLPGGFKIGKRKMRGVESHGMMCSARELGLGDDHGGLLIMDPGAKVGEDALGALGLDDVILEIEVTPNRGDWASMVGVARELAAAYGTSFRMPEVTLNESGKTASDVSSVTLENPELCPRYVGRVLTNVTVGPSPTWMVQRLTAAGQRPINNIVDITNYVLMETGQPLHAFDFDKLGGNRIVVRTARDGEKIKTIDQTEHTLTSERLVIADAEVPVAIAGVMGGFDSEVGEDTTSVFVESACFEPRSIRQTSRALNTITEASQRFQRGADLEMAVYAANRVCQLIQEIAGGEVAPGILDEYPAPAEQKSVSLTYERAYRLLGTRVDPGEQRSILASLGFELSEETAEGCTALVPSWRHDVSLDVDLIEEIARLHGYDSIEARIPSVRRTEETLSPAYTKERSLRAYLRGIGLTETMNWTFGTREELGMAKLDALVEKAVRLENPLSENHEVMRASLIPIMLNTLSKNLRKGSNNLRLYEMGPVYFEAEEASSLPDQQIRLVVAFTGRAAAAHWGEEPRDVDLFDLKGCLEGVLSHMGSNFAFKPDDVDWCEGGQALRRSVRKKMVGVLGLVHPAVLTAFEIEQPVFLAELNLDSLFNARHSASTFEEIPAFPPSLRDMAVVVDDSIQAGDVLATAARTGGKLLKSIDLFDIFTGKQVPDGKKSIALSLVFQSNERTLTDKDTQKSWDKILKKLQADFGAELR